MAVDTAGIKSGDFSGALGLSNFSFGTLGNVLMWGFGIVIVLAILGFILFWWINKRTYTQNIWIFGKVGGVPMLKFIDRGRMMPFGMAGDRLLNLKKMKKYLPPPRIQMGKDIYWFYEREDGELINFSLEDLDEKQRKAGAYYVDTDMRMQRLGIEKNLRERMERKGFFEKYGSTIAGAIFVIMVTVALVVLFSKLKDVAGSMDAMAGSVNAMASSVDQFYSARIGGESPADVSGLVPALMPLVFWRRKKK